LNAFFSTEKEFSKRGEVKKLIDANTLLSLCSSGEEEVAGSAGWLFSNVFSVYYSRDGKGEHGDFVWMKEKGMLMKMYSTFKGCVVDMGKRLVGNAVLCVDRGCSLGEKTFEVVEWLRDNTDGSTDDVIRGNTLTELRRVTYRFSSFICSV
jgi:hypothetical protein